MSGSFITIGSVRIKKSNIKTFGVSTKKRYERGLGGALRSLQEGESFLDGFFGNRTESYLFVTTYQGDNYRFSEREISIEQTTKELEAL